MTVPRPAPRIDPYSLRLFLAVARAGSIVRGAAQEHIAPSALGRRLDDLEHAFGAALLVRSPRGVALTEAGRLVLARGGRIDDALQELAREVRMLDGTPRGRVRLHANASAVVGFLPERLRAFLAAHPQVEVSLQEADTPEVLRACLDDRADLGVCVESPVPAGLEGWHFADDPLLVLLPRGHALAAGGSRGLRFAQVLDHPLVGVHPDGALARFLAVRADALGRAMRITVSVQGFDAVCRMVEAGLGIAVVPTSALAGYAGSRRFARRALAEPWAARALWMYALRKQPRLRSVQALADALRGSGPGRPA
jgi:DNA-binding transcriptional LysR family regulator